jgi:transposase
MAHLHKKMKKGRPYYYVREIARVDGKPKVVNQVYIGGVERILELATGAAQGGEPVRLQAQEFGALWLAQHIESKVGLAGIIDALVPHAANEKGPSVGEYFLYCVFNRLIDAASKRALPDWFKSTAIQHIRPVDTDALTSQRFWKKWERVGEAELEAIAKALFHRLAELEPPRSDCFMFDTTNYFTYMASDTQSDLAKRGKNKDGKDWLRQIGLALLVERDTRLPLFYRVYEGNRHDSKVFARVLDSMSKAMADAAPDANTLTMVFDKGMNAEENIASIDSRERLGFVTTYSTYFAEELAQVDRARFAYVDTPRNRRLKEAGRSDDLLLAWRTRGEFWGLERTVVVTYNPLTASKQRYSFDRKLEELQQELYSMRAKFREQKAQWKSEQQFRKRYAEICRALYLSDDLYDLEFSVKDGDPRMSFRKNHYRIGKQINKFGKNILITDRHAWSTDEIVQASLDRYAVEESFRQSKDDDLVGAMPVRHWTDSKIRCHLFCCVAALAYLRLIDLQLKRAEVEMTAASAMRELHRLHSCFVWSSAHGKPKRIIEEPTEIQAKILKAFGQEISSGVLHETKL